MKIEYESTPYKGEPSRGTGSVVTEVRPGWVMRTRGEHGRMVRHDFECPVHGVFEAMVPSGEVPDSVRCTVDLRDRCRCGCLMTADGCSRLGCPYESTERCEVLSPWRAQQIAVGWSAGSVRC